MAIIFYGTKTFTKLQGYFGQRSECPQCHKVYAPAYVKVTRWAHVDEVPLFPVNTKYLRLCPVCAAGVELKKKEAKAEMASLGPCQTQRLTVYAKHILANKPKGILKVDNSYELWLRDDSTGEEFRLASNTTKDLVLKQKKLRGLKKLEIIKV